MSDKDCEMRISDPTLNSVPMKPGIYKLYQRKSGGDLKLLYIGKTENLRSRLFNHPVMYDEFSYRIVIDEELRTNLEKYLISEFEPPMNEQFNDNPNKFSSDAGTSQEISPSPASQTRDRVSKDAQYLLFAVNEDSSRNLTELYQFCTSGPRAKRELLKYGLVEEYSPEEAKGNEKRLELTEEGQKWIDSHIDDLPELSEYTIDFLKDIVERPFIKTSDRYSLLPSAGTGNRVKNELIDKGFVREKWIHAESRFKLLELTPKGRHYLRLQGIECSCCGRGGIVHRFWQKRIKDWFEAQGKDAVREKDHADVCVEDGSEQIAVEIAMEATEREMDHIQDRLSHSFDQVILVVRSQKVLLEVRELLQEQDLSDEAVDLRETAYFENPIEKSESAA